MYLLYGDRGSGSCAVECALAEIGARYAVRELSLEDGEHRSKDYEAINPQRKIPSLVIGDKEILTESVAILLTLDARHSEARLLPVEECARGQALRWLVFVATEIYPVVEINDYPERFAPGRDRIAAMRERAREIWRERWLIVEENASGDQYFLSDGFSLADIYIAVVSRWAQQDRWRRINLPKIERLTAAVASRPAIAPVWAHHFGSV